MTIKCHGEIEQYLVDRFQLWERLAKNATGRSGQVRNGIRARVVADALEWLRS